MSDEPLSPDHEQASALLASAYVDGQATAQERAQVEASPELLALVQTYRTIRTSMRAVAPPSAQARDAALAAALATFDGLGVEDVVAATAPERTGVAAGAPVAPPRPNVVSIERRRRWNQVLVAAAAVAIVGVAGVALAGMFSGSDQDSASTGSVLAADANTESAGSSKVGVAGVEDGTVAAITSDPAAPPSSDISTQPTETIGSIDGGASPVPEYTEPAALRSLPEPTSRVAPTFEFECPLESTQELVLEITWRGTPALVVRDTVTRLITVLDAQCTTLVTVQP